MRRQLCPLLGGLILALMAYAGWLTSDWRSLLSCAPAILVIVAVVGGLTAGVMFFGTVEGVTREELAVARSPSSIPFVPLAAPEPRSIYNERKIQRVLSGIEEVPQKHARKKKRPREVAQVLEQSCTGCGLCVPFCPVDCIETESASDWPDRLPPARILYDECVGCGICVKVCERLAWDATVMRPTTEIELEEGIVIHDTLPLDLDRFRTGF